MMSDSTVVSFITIDEKNMANGMRNLSRTPLTEEEIEIVRKEIQRIDADESVFVFNDEIYIKRGTCYNWGDDKVYVVRDVFPDEEYASGHPRDTMSIGAVLAHEYYGHRPNRQEYQADFEIAHDYHTIPLWEDECRASLMAAQFAPGLTDLDRRDLVLDAVFRAKEAGQVIKMNDFMKEVIYGYGSKERYFTAKFEYPVFVNETG